MSIYTRKQFYEACGILKSTMYVNIKRGKVILSGDVIDTSIQANREFLEKCLAKQKIPVEKTPHIEAEEKPTEKYYEPSVNSLELEKKLKQAELEKKEVDTRIALLKEEKLRGSVVPTDIVKVVFSQHFKSINSSFHQAADNLIVNIAKKKDLDRNEIAEIRGELVEIINIAVNDAIEESKKSIKNIVAEYSDKKGVGERT